MRNCASHIGMRIHDRVAFGSSLWRRFARCVARSVIVVAGKFASILICGLDYSSCVTHSHNLNSDTRNENVDQLFFHKQKCRNIFFLVRNERRGFFSQAPCISQAPFHVPIRGGYQGGARLSIIDCSDTTQSLQVSLEGQFKKSFLGLSSSIQEVGKLFLVSPQNTSS